MRTIEVTINVDGYGSAVIHTGNLLKPGRHKVLIIVEESVLTENDIEPKKRKILSGLNVIRLKQWPAHSTFRRVEIYNDDGR